MTPAFYWKLRYGDRVKAQGLEGAGDPAFTLPHSARPTSEPDSVVTQAFPPSQRPEPLTPAILHIRGSATTPEGRVRPTSPTPPKRGSSPITPLFAPDLNLAEVGLENGDGPC